MSTLTQTQGEQYRETVASATIVTKYVRMIIAQADIPNITELPNLPTHQAAAKTQSEKWLSEIWPLIIKTTTDIIDYANTFQAAYDEMITLIPKLRSGDVTAKDEVVQILDKILQTNLKTIQESSASVSGSITTYYNGFEVLYQAFQTDFISVEAKISADNSSLDSLITERDGYLMVANQREHAAIVAGLAIPGIAVVTLVTSETGIALIAGGIVVALDLVAIGVLLAQYAEALKNYYDTIKKINKLNTEITALHAIESQITGLQKNTLEVKTYSNNFADGWSKLADSMDAVMAKIKTSTPEDISYIIPKELGNAYSDWGQILAQAKIMQPNGGQLEVTTFKTYDDMLNVLDKQAATATAAGTQ